MHLFHWRPLTCLSFFKSIVHLPSMIASFSLDSLSKFIACVPEVEVQPSSLLPIQSSPQFADVCMKLLPSSSFHSILSKLGLSDIADLELELASDAWAKARPGFEVL
ncbi:hypothetical protein VNO77_17200 [Canavalia gladiata]|uniref:Uncharacterized protein n=1 Tax=Canavalia gladiata TaxID=3824 RepID=A0AAN9LM20_CANGL